jgi:putative chitinase
VTWAASQDRLRAAGFDPGVTDGQPGPRTYAAIFAYIAGRADQRTADLGAAAAELFPSGGLTTPLRVAHFMAQAATESGRFRFMREIWGPTDAQRRYEGRADLGNCIAGDGRKFLGRGIFQITGRDNYQRYGQMLGIDLACSPELAEQPFNAVAIACLYWKANGLNEYADRDDVLAVSNGINRGNPKSTRTPNGFDDRKAMLVKAKAVLS